MTCYDIQDDQKSIEYYKKAGIINPNDDRVYYGLAASQFVLGQFKEAESNCEIAVKLNPNDIDASTLLNRINNK